MASSRRLLTLSDLGRVVTGKTPKTAVEENFGGVTPFVTPTDLDGRKFIGTTIRNLSGTGLASVKSSALPKNTVMVSCIGSDMGKVAMTCRESVSNQQINSIIVEPDHDSAYVYYNLLGRRVELRAMAGGSAQPILNKSAFGRVQIELPEKEEQIAVSEFLGALDDRIDLLRQTNATLEAIAQALFKSWFVDFDPVRAKAEGREPEGMDPAAAALFPSEFEASELGLIPKGWRRGTLGDLCRNIRQQAMPDSLDPTTPYIGLEHMPRGSIALTEAGSASGLASGKFWYAKNDVLFGKLRPYFHKVGVASHTGVCSTDILVVRANEPDWFGFTAMQLSSDEIIAYATRLSNGAKMPRSSWSDIAAYKVVIPPEPVASSFDGLVRAIIERIHANIDRATNLACLRDTLLPRLISGQLRLTEVEKSIEEAVA